MFVMDCYGHKLSNGVLFAHHLILDVPGGSSHLGYRRRVPLGHNPPTAAEPVPNQASWEDCIACCSRVRLCVMTSVGRGPLDIVPRGSSGSCLPLQQSLLHSGIPL